VHGDPGDGAHRRHPVEGVAHLLGLCEKLHAVSRTVHPDRWAEVSDGERDKLPGHDEVQVRAALPELRLGRALHVDADHLDGVTPNGLRAQAEITRELGRTQERADRDEAQVGGGARHARVTDNLAHPHARVTRHELGHGELGVPLCPPARDRVVDEAGEEVSRAVAWIGTELDARLQDGAVDDRVARQHGRGARRELGRDGLGAV
jgi:hypothetical protein